MKIMLAPNAFKGSLSAMEAACAMERASGLALRAFMAGRNPGKKS